MRAKDFKGRCIKRKLTKCEDTVRTYDQLQTVYADMLQNDNEIVSFKCNVLLSDIPEGEFTTDFLCEKTDGDFCVRECVYRKKLLLPRTARLLDISKEYWERRGITDWAIVTEKNGLSE